jgi:predicted ATP-grasp superfamily ATP-dependent carboligase
MSAPNQLLIFGASTRAAAFSALRAGLRPRCADLFADADLEARCPVTQVLTGSYPQQFLDLARTDVPGPWMYTGALENQSALVRAIAHHRPLFGNDTRALKRARSPDFIASLLGGAGIPCPALFYEYPAEVPSEGRWLIKPLASGGGTGIRFWSEELAPAPLRRRAYLQEYIEGEPCSAVYVGDGRQARLLGVTQQLVGEIRMHAAPFRYCGSFGPLPIDEALQQRFERLGNVLASGCRLKGLFGVDCVLADGVPYPVEINPRYPASVEVLEHGLGLAALRLHCEVFDPDAQRLARNPNGVESRGSPHDPPKVIGKAIVFAWRTLLFPADGPWQESVGHGGDQSRRSFEDAWELPAFADIPHPGERIDTGRPILTVFAEGDTLAGCRERLWQIAREVEDRLFGRGD